MEGKLDLFFWTLIFGEKIISKCCMEYVPTFSAQMTQHLGVYGYNWDIQGCLNNDMY